jgi:hypothetical protein
MARPASALTTLRPDLAPGFEEFNLAMDREGFIGLQVLPVIDVAVQNGVFPRMRLEDMLQEHNLARTSGAGYQRTSGRFEDDDFKTREYGVEEVVDDRDNALYSEWFDSEVWAVQRAVDRLLRHAEYRIAQAVFNTSTWTGSALTTSVGTEWSTISSDPILDIDNARKKVYDGTGLWPNTLIINRKVYHNLRRNTKVIDAIEASGAGVSAKQSDISPELLAQVFDVTRVLVAGASRNSANEGQAASIGQIWSSEYAMLCVTSGSGDIRQPCIGRTIHWGADGSSLGGTVETYEEIQTRAHIVRVRHEVQEKIIYPEAGHLLSNITA